MGRQHPGMDRPGVRQVPEGSEEQGKMEETGCEVICGAPTTLADKEYMMLKREYQRYRIPIEKSLWWNDSQPTRSTQCTVSAFNECVSFVIC